MMAGKVDYYDTTTSTYSGSIKLTDPNTALILGLIYDPSSGYVFVTGQTSPKGHVWAIDPNTNAIVSDTLTSADMPSFPCVDSSSHRLFARSRR